MLMNVFKKIALLCVCSVANSASTVTDLTSEQVAVNINKERGQYGIATAFSDNFIFLEPFASYYGVYWKMDRILLMVGFTPRTNQSDVLARLRAITGSCNSVPIEGIELSNVLNNVTYMHCATTDFERGAVFGNWTLFDVILYSVKSREEGVKHWDLHTKFELEKVARREFFPKVANVKFIDSDEFHYHANVEFGKSQAVWQNHIVELLPRIHFEPWNGFEWVNQAYYYRHNALEKTGAGPLTLDSWHRHVWDFFVGSNGFEQHHHLGGPRTDICDDLDSYMHNVSAIVDILMTTHFVMHMSVLSLPFFVHSKHWNQVLVKPVDEVANPNPNMKDFRTQMFFKHYLDPSPHFERFTLNILQPYWLPFVNQTRDWLFV